jgi:hypothetical protein
MMFYLENYGVEIYINLRGTDNSKGPTKGEGSLELEERSYDKYLKLRELIACQG